MREIRLSGSEGGVALTPPSLPLSDAGSRIATFRWQEPENVSRHAENPDAWEWRRFLPPECGDRAPVEAPTQRGGSPRQAVIHPSVTEGYCVVVTRGGELLEVNNPSVTT